MPLKVGVERPRRGRGVGEGRRGAGVGEGGAGGATTQPKISNYIYTTCSTWIIKPRDD